MITPRIGRSWLLWALGGVLFTGLSFAISSNSPAQGDKDGKGKEKEPVKKAKAKPPPAEFKKRIDFVDPSQGGTEHVGIIDDEIRKAWKENSTYPSDRCTDHEFIRRASLDIIGRIPTVKEIDRFLKHPQDKRRSWLINAMLDGKEYGEGSEYAQNFANMWTVNLMTRTGSAKPYQIQMNNWLYDHFRGSSESPPDWSVLVRELVAGKGDTNRNAAVNYLLHNLGEEIKQDENKSGKWDMVPATSRTTRLFLGVRTQCVQCHDHPFSGDLGQHQFWGINAFFRQADSNGRPSMMMRKQQKGVVGAQQFELKDKTTFNSAALIPYERRNTVVLFTDPSYLNGKKIPKDFKGTRREALAKFITEDPSFAKAFVNRMWGHFFGKSMTNDAVDDFGEHNPVSHPLILDTLSKDWAEKYAHNPKVLIRWICNSQAYGLSSRANEWNDKQEDETLFARMLLKPMTPEQMFESLMIATDASLSKNKEDKLKAKEAWFSKLVVNFGNDEGEEGTFSGTVIQALLLMNGKDINTAITEKDGAVAVIASKRGASLKSLPFAIQDMYMLALGRPATQKELANLTSPAYYTYQKTRRVPTNAQEWTYYYQDVFWALLNSNEFILNH